MDKQQYLDHIRLNSMAIADAARRDSTAPTLQTPGWTPGHVAVHVGRAFRWIEEIVRLRAQAPLIARTNEHSFDRLDPGLVPWYLESLALFLTTAEAAGEDEPVWSWAGENRVGFWLRLMAHETAIHRTDAQSAFGEPAAIETVLARDTLDGLFQWFLPRARTRTMLPCAGATLRFIEDGGDGAWQLRIENDHATPQPPDGAADVIARGSASDLALFLWQRQDLDRLEIEGDRSLIERYKELLPLS